jgi:hypothetical protein
MLEPSLVPILDQIAHKLPIDGGVAKRVSIKSTWLAGLATELLKLDNR